VYVVEGPPDETVPLLDGGPRVAKNQQKVVENDRLGERISSPEYF